MAAVVSTQNVPARKLAARGISTPFHYIPLDNTLGGRRYARAFGDLPVTHSAASRLVRLPLWFGMRTEQDKVIEATFDYFFAV
jgi:dTDP-4-amino-4,6-dideoxygalactose transaminase